MTCSKKSYTTVRIAPNTLMAAAQISCWTASSNSRIAPNALSTCCLTCFAITSGAKSRSSRLHPLEWFQAPLVSLINSLFVSIRVITLTGIQDRFPRACRRGLHLAIRWHPASIRHVVPCCWSQNAFQVQMRGRQCGVEALLSVYIVRKHLLFGCRRKLVERGLYRICKSAAQGQETSCKILSVELEVFLGCIAPSGWYAMSWSCR